jgi:hypothetical protein
VYEKMWIPVKSGKEVVVRNEKPIPVINHV